jgi:hypothetical protein
MPACKVLSQLCGPSAKADADSGREGNGPMCGLGLEHRYTYLPTETRAVAAYDVGLFYERSA